MSQWFSRASATVFVGKHPTSAAGMRLFLTRELPFGTSLTLEFLMPYNTMQLVVRGVIRNRDGFTHGVEFLNPTDQQQLIERTCKIFQLLS